MQVKKHIIKLHNFEVNALFFLPADPLNNNANKFAIFTHGYTSHKGDVLNWAHRLAFSGLNAAIFDLPGHYLGSFNIVNDFNEFTEYSPLLFLKAKEHLSELTFKEPETLILGGHSLGSFFALQALELEEFKGYQKCAICVGSTYTEKNQEIFLESAFYHDTLVMREQLVSPSIRSTAMFPWIKERISLLDTRNKKIHLITGNDDVIVGDQGTQKLYNYLLSNSNDVTMFMPKSLPHHRPELASPFIYSYLKEQNLIH